MRLYSPTHDASCGIDLHARTKIAQLLSGGNLHCACAYPRRFRATRDLLRRRLPFVRFRSELLTIACARCPVSARGEILGVTIFY